MKNKLGGVLCLAAIASCLGSPTTVTLRPVADAEIQQAAPDNNFGSDATMVSGALGFTVGKVIRRGLVRFDLTGQIPAGAIINSVTLQVRVVRVPIGPANSVFDLRRILQPWSETGVTWNSRLPATRWQVPGVTGTADSVASPSSSVFVAGLGGYTFGSTARLVTDVQTWVDNPSTNAGWLLISEDEVTAKTARHFATREDANNAPVLTVTYTVPPPVILVEPLDQTADEGSTATFSVVADGVPPLSFQWQVDGNDIVDATNSVLTLSNVQTNEAGSYAVIVRNAGGATPSQAASLTVVPLSALLPRVSLNSPTNGMKFPDHADVTLAASITVSNATISQVEFFTNGSPVVVLSNSPFSFMLSNLPAGNYALKATATDSAGRSNDSATVSIRVLPTPAIALISPEDDARLPLNTNSTLSAVLLPPTLVADVVRVQFFEDSSLIGELASPPFTTNWIPTVTGDHALRAVVTDEVGQSGTSTNVAVHIFIPEKVRPSVTITLSPPNFLRMTSPLVQLSGTASDDMAVDRVEWQVNGGARVPANLRVGSPSRWDARVMLVPGPNAVRVFAVDQAENDSLPAIRFFTYVVSDRLTVQIDPPGSGTVFPNLTNALLEIGKVYRLTAKPARDYLFAGWSNNVPSQGAVLNFVMQSNLVLTVKFIENPFLTRAGDYSGLVLDTNSPMPESSGLLNLKVTKIGAFSGTLTLAGNRRSLRGQFDASGHALTAITRPQQNPVTLDLQFDVTNNTDSIIGKATDGIWVSAVIANRNIFNSRTNPAPQAGSRSFFLQTTGSPPTTVASVLTTIDTAGAATVSGGLSGRRFYKFTTTLGRDCELPFYASFNHGSEVLVGWLTNSVTATPPVNAKIYWVNSGTNQFFFELQALSGGP